MKPTTARIVRLLQAAFLATLPAFFTVQIHKSIQETYCWDLGDSWKEEECRQMIRRNTADHDPALAHWLVWSLLTYNAGWWICLVGTPVYSLAKKEADEQWRSSHK